jgi:hypothetical protein
MMPDWIPRSRNRNPMTGRISCPPRMRMRINIPHKSDWLSCCCMCLLFTYISLVKKNKIRINYTHIVRSRFRLTVLVLMVGGWLSFWIHVNHYRVHNSVV